MYDSYDWRPWLCHKTNVIYCVFRLFFEVPPTQMTTYDQKFGMKMIARTWRIFWSINWVKVVDFHNWSRYPYGYLTITKSSWIPVKWPIFDFSLISADSWSIKLHFKSVWQNIRRTRDSWTGWSFGKKCYTELLIRNERAQ